MAHPLRDLLNARKWHHHDLDACVLVVRHRGAPGDRREISGADVIDIGAGGLAVENLEEDVVLPWHRLLQVRRGDHVLWTRAGADLSPVDPWAAFDRVLEDL